MMTNSIIVVRFGIAAMDQRLNDVPEAVRKLAKVIEMHDLGDQAAPDDPNPQPAGHINSEI